jgi:hypothetical protein
MMTKQLCGCGEVFIGPPNQSRCPGCRLERRRETARLRVRRSRQRVTSRLVEEQTTAKSVEMQPSSDTKRYIVRVLLGMECL